MQIIEYFQLFSNLLAELAHIYYLGTTQKFRVCKI